MIDLILTNGLTITMDDKRRIIENGAVAINNGKIIEVDNTDKLVSKYKAKEEINCDHHCILPGLIDAHGHGGHSMFKTLATDNISYWMPILTKTYKHYVTDDFWYYEGKLSALERLKAGITTGVSVIGSMPRSDDPIFAINHAKAYSETGIREIVCTGPCNPPWPQTFSRWINGKKIEKKVTFRQALEGAEVVIEKLNHSSQDRIRAFITPFVITTSVNPSSPTPPDQLYKLTKHDYLQNKEIRRIAKKYNTRIHSDAFGGMIHLSVQDENNALLGPDVHLQHCRGISFDEAKILAETGTNVSVAPGVSQIKERTPITELIELEVDVAISTDGTSPYSAFDMFQAMRKTRMIHQAALKDYYYLPPEKLLEMVTIDAAKCVGWDDELGSLEAGKKADVITVNMEQAHLTPEFMPVHRLVYEAVATDMDNVVVDGKMIMRNRKALMVDDKKVIKEANQVSKETIKRAGLEKYMGSEQHLWGQARAYLDKNRHQVTENEN